MLLHSRKAALYEIFFDRFLICFTGMGNMSGYQQLCTEFYDLTKPEAKEKEIEFYGNFLKTVTEPCLEAMCGSGRLLLPLLRRGYQIDGLDNSSHMLESCSQRCKLEKLNVNLFNQSLQNLSLPHKYGLIFIAIGSFQLIENRFEALIILKRLYDHLISGGILLIETFVPWDSIKDSIDAEILKDKSVVPFEKKISSPDGFEIIHKGQTTVYPKEQLEISESKYEKNRSSKKGRY